MPSTRGRTLRPDARPRRTSGPDRPSMTTAEAARPSVVRRLFGWLYRRPRLQLAGLLAAPVGWFGIVYFGSLALLFVVRVLVARPADRLVIRHSPSPTSSGSSTSRSSRRSCCGRSRWPRSHGRRRDHRLPDRLLHGPRRLAAAPGTAVHLGPVAALGELPGQGLRLAGHPRPERRSTGPPSCSAWAGQRLFGISTCRWIVFIYIWLPYMILPIYAGLERVPRLVPRGLGRSRWPGGDDVP